MENFNQNESEPEQEQDDTMPIHAPSAQSGPSMLERAVSVSLPSPVPLDHVDLMPKIKGAHSREKGISCYIFYCVFMIQCMISQWALSIINNIT